MLFLVHDEDGRVMQANKVYYPEGYAGQLHDAGYKFIEVDQNTVPETDKIYVKNSKVAVRPTMNIRSSADRVATGKSVVVKGIPRGVMLTILLEGYEAVPLHREELLDTSLEFVPPQPGTYLITFEKFPYMVCSLKVHAS